MFGALKRGRFRSLASLILVVNVVGELTKKRTLAASRGFLAAARLSCLVIAAKTSSSGGSTSGILSPERDRKQHLPRGDNTSRPTVYDNRG